MAAFTYLLAMCPILLVFSFRGSCLRWIEWALSCARSLLSESRQTNIASTHGPQPELLTKGQVQKRYESTTWQRQAYEAFAAKLVDKSKTFPCIYATKGYKEDDLIFMFLKSEDVSERQNVGNIAQAILTYVPKSHDCGLNTSLVILTPNSDKNRSVDDYHKLFWAFLKSLRQLDPKPWPSNVSEDTNDPRWCFCFDGKLAFMAVLTPAHHQRHSRYNANFAIIYQPRWIFELLLSTEQKREQALKTVRGLIDKYDYPLPHSPDMSNFGDPGKTESRQYFILDENKTAYCPYSTLVSP